MSIFADYFRDTLRYRPVLAGGPLAIMAYGGALLLDAVRELILSLRDQFFVERCEASRLVKFARARGITRQPFETVERYQARIRLAYIYHSRGGRAGGMAQFLSDYFGFGTVLIESLRSVDPARWAEFTVKIVGQGSATTFDEAEIRWVLNEIKPARSKVGEIRPPGAPEVFRASRNRAGDKLLYWPIETP